MKLYVGNLAWKIDDNALKKLFAPYDAEEANIIKDKFSGRSKGFGFVIIEDDKTASKAISEMNEKEIEGRVLTVSEARPMIQRDNAPGKKEFGEAPSADPDTIAETQMSE